MPFRPVTAFAFLCAFASLREIGFLLFPSSIVRGRFFRSPVLPSSIVHRPSSLIIAAALVLAPLIYWPRLWDYALGPKLLVLQVLLALSLAIWTLAKKRAFILPDLALPAVLYTAVAFLSALYAPDPAMALLESTKILTGLILLLVVANRLPTTDIPTVLTASACTGILIALLGIAQYHGWQPFSIPSAGLPSATLGYRNIAAMYLIANLPLTIALYATAPSRTYLHASAIALMAIFLIYTRTRGAWVGLCVSLVITAVLCYRASDKYADKGTLRRRKRWLFPSSIVHRPSSLKSGKRLPLLIATLVVFALGALPSSMVKQGPQSLDENKTTLDATVKSIVQQGGDKGRLTSWKNTLPMIADHPLFGVGLGNWAIALPPYDRGDQIAFGAAPENPHSDPVGILSELGLIGFICYLSFSFCVLRRAWRLMQMPDAQTRWMATACFAGFLALSIHSCFDFPRERVVPVMFFWFLPGLIAAMSRTGARVSPPVTKIILPLLCLLAIAQIAFTVRIIQFDAHMYRARQAERQGDWAQVAEETARARKAGRFHPESIYLSGYALNTLGRFEEARSLYASARPHRPNDIQIHNGLAIAAQHLGRPDEAETHYRLALALIPSAADIHYNLAGLYLQTGRPQEAAEAYLRVIEIESSSLEIHHRLALAFLLARQNDRAVEWLKRAFDKFPHEGHIHLEWIDGFFQQHRIAGIARQSYQLFIALWPGNAQYAEIARQRLHNLESPTNTRETQP